MSKILVYDNGEMELTVSVSNDSIWLKTEDIAQLFDVNRPAIVKHIGNIYKTDELSEYSTCSILEQVAKDGKKRKVNFYNLDMIIAVGYRVNSKKATQFRIWATNVLKEYIYNGYVINSQKITVDRFMSLENDVKDIKQEIQNIKQYKNLTLKTSNKYHDRFLIVDDKEVYHLGASLKDLGKKVFAFSQIDREMLKWVDNE